MTTGALATFGWLPWPEATKLVGSAGATWLGTGSLIEQAPISWPQDLPLTTRIYAWSMDDPLLWRLLPAQPRGLILVTALRLGQDKSTPPWPSPPDAEEVVSITSSTDGGWTRVWVDDPAPIMFLHPASREHELVGSRNQARADE